MGTSSEEEQSEEYDSGIETNLEGDEIDAIVADEDVLGGGDAWDDSAIMKAFHTGLTSHMGLSPSKQHRKSTKSKKKTSKAPKVASSKYKRGELDAATEELEHLMLSEEPGEPEQQQQQQQQQQQWPGYDQYSYAYPACYGSQASGYWPYAPPAAQYDAVASHYPHPYPHPHPHHPMMPPAYPTPAAPTPPTPSSTSPHPPPLLLPPPPSPSSSELALSDLLMSWYYSGYYTGRFKALMDLGLTTDVSATATAAAAAAAAAGGGGAGGPPPAPASAPAPVQVPATSPIHPSPHHLPSHPHYPPRIHITTILPMPPPPPHPHPHPHPHAPAHPEHYAYGYPPPPP